MGLFGMFSKKPAARSVRRRRARPRGQGCAHCGAACRPGARCSNCGRQAHVVEPFDPSLYPDPTVACEREILLHAAGVGRREPSVFTHAAHGDAEGEVKAGSQRIFGNAAVTAVDRLVRSGHLEPDVDEGYRLTLSGAARARRISRKSEPSET